MSKMKMKRPPAPRKNTIPSGAVQKSGGGGAWQNTILPLRPELRRALKMKSQATKPEGA